jgi:type II secretory pathway component PulM
MILSKRERYIGIATGAVVTLLALDWFIFTPLLERRQRVQSEIELAQLELDRATLLFKNSKAVNARWREMLDSGVKTDASAAESQVLQAVHDWARESGLTMSSIKRERTDRVKQFQQITLRAAANGNMSAASRFMYRVQTARVPVRITDLLISSSRKEGTDDLSLTLGISTIYLAPEPRKNETPGVQTATAWEGGR